MTLEDHLEEICPVCCEKHEACWEHTFERDTAYIVTPCNNCGYIVYKKLGFMTDGTATV